MTLGHWLVFLSVRGCRYAPILTPSHPHKIHFAWFDVSIFCAFFKITFASWFCVSTQKHPQKKPGEQAARN